jgi:hypothetical protein
LKRHSPYKVGNPRTTFFAEDFCRMNTFDFLSPGGQPVLVCRLPNERGKGKPVHRYVHNETELQGFISTHDEPGYALYHAVAIFKEGAWRNKQNVEGTRYIWTEVDFKDHPDFSAEEIRRRIETIPLRPTAVIFSGHGYHLYWQLKEDADARPGEAQRQIEEALRLAVNYVSGDTQVAEAARIMRLPGSHNTRVPGEELPVVFDEVELSRAYGLDELIDFFLEAAPILPAPAKKANGNGHDASGLDFEAVGPVDSDGELSAIRNGASVNAIQCRVIPSLIWKAWHPDEIVRFVVDGTMRAAEQAGLGWDRATEVKHVIARILSAYHNMFESTYDASTGVIPVWLPGEFHEVWAKILVEGRCPTIMRNGAGFHVRRKQGAAEGVGSTDGADDAAGAPESQQAREERSSDGADEDEMVLRKAGALIHGEAPPPEPECSFRGILPRSGAGSIVAQPSCGKTFIGVDLCVASSAESGRVDFADSERVRRGGAVIIEFEHSQISQRVAAAMKHRGVTDAVLPLMSFTHAPPMLSKKKVNKVAVEWYRRVLGAAHRYFMRKFGLPLVVVHVDPLIDAAGYESENDSAEGGAAMKAFVDLGHELDCIFHIADHAGKDLEKGARGTSAKHGKVDFEFILGEKVDDLSTRRNMKVKKLRNLPDGWSVVYWFKLQEVEIAGGGAATTRVVCWGEAGRNVGEDPESGPSAMQRRALRVLGEMMAEVPPKRGEMVWVNLDAWREELISQAVIDPDDENPRRTWKRIVDGLWDKRLIVIRNQRARIPVATNWRGDGGEMQ